MKWRDILHKENEYAKQATNEALESRADPKVQIAQRLQALQEHHEALQSSAAQVIANNKQTEMRLADALRKQAKLTASIQAAMTNGHTDTARTFALQLAPVEEQIESLKAMHEATVAAAEQAKQALQDNADEMQVQIAKAQELRMQVDQAAMQHQMAANMAEVTKVSSVVTPTFDGIADKVQADFALSSAQLETAGTDPSVAAMHAHHQEIQDSADAILARFQPAAISAGDGKDA